MRYLSLDLETTGLNWRNCKPLCIAALVCDHDKDEPTASFIEYFNYPSGVHCELTAMYINREILDTCTRRGDSEKAVLQKFDLFLREHFGGRYAVTVAGKNVGAYDYNFFPNRSGGSVILEHGSLKARTLDPSLFYFDPVKDGSLVPSLKECCNRAGINSEGLHTAFGDALMVHQLLRKYWAKNG